MPSVSPRASAKNIAYTINEGYQSSEKTQNTTVQHSAGLIINWNKKLWAD